MKVELKGLQIVERMSEETMCFTANVYVDGKKAGHAENRGTGGSTDVRIAPPELAKKVEEYGKTLVPPEYKGFTSGTEWLVDQLVDAVAQKRHDAKEARRIAKYDAREKARYAAEGMGCVRFRNGEAYHWAGVKKTATVESVKAALEKKYPDLEDWVVVS